MEIEVKIVKLSKIKLNPDNPRTITEKAMANLVKSLQDFPDMMSLREIIVDEKMMVLGGNMRLLALQKIGAKEATAKIVKGLTPEQKREFVIKDNAAFGEWDMDVLANSWGDLPLTEWGIGLPEEWAAPRNEEDQGEIEDKDLNINPQAFKDLAPTNKELELLKEKQIIIEFSGGKDSLSASLWVKNFFSENRVILLYCDLGSEFVSMQPFLYETAELLGFELVTVRSEINIFDVILKENKWPFHAFPYCQKWLATTLNKFIKNNFISDNIVIVRGSIARQRKGHSKKRGSRFSDHDNLKDFSFFNPMYFIDKKVEEEILSESHIPIWSGYSYGLQRTACRICPGQKSQAYAAIRYNYPDVWEELIWLEKKLGVGCWQGPLMTTAGQKRKQVRQLSFVESADRGQYLFDAGNYKLRRE